MEAIRKPVYHVVVQSVYQGQAFGNDRNKEAYLQRIVKYKQAMKMKLYAFCLYEDHAHFLVQGEEWEVSGLMRRVGVSFSHWYRKTYFHEGTLFKGRPKTEQLKNDAEILRVARFIHQEPVRRGLVESMEEYPWSSYRMYQEENSLIDRDEVAEKLRFWGRFEDYMSIHETTDYLEEQPPRFGRSDDDVLRLVLKRLNGHPLIELQVLPRSVRDYILAKLRFEDKVSILQLARVTGLGRGIIQRVTEKDLRLTLYRDTCIIHSEDRDGAVENAAPDYGEWRISMKQQTVFSAGTILLPRNINPTVWSTIACDQFTSDPEYWERVRQKTAGKPSCYHITLPEIYLTEGDEAVSARIQSINQTMQRYLKKDFLAAEPSAMIYVERTLANGKTRKGLMGLVDLEEYDYTKTSKACIRATEETVLERIPPRVRIRENAPMEFPHLMLLADDAENQLIEPLSAKKAAMRKCYDFELMEGSGHIRGYVVSEAEKDRVLRVLDVMADPRYFSEKYKTSEPVLLFAVGDGNHSLATAKVCYENLKQKIGDEEARRHPARYALAEVVNLHDESLVFEPIYRVLFETDPDEVLAALLAAYPGSHTGEAEEGEAAIEYVSGETGGTIAIPDAAGRLPVSLLQPVLDRYLQERPGRIDYIHGRGEAQALGRGEGCIAFLFEGMRKEDLFPGIIAGGVLPRKTFSMGEARDKRFYLEGRRIQ